MKVTYMTDFLLLLHGKPFSTHYNALWYPIEGKPMYIVNQSLLTLSKQVASNFSLL